MSAATTTGRTSAKRAWYAAPETLSRDMVDELPPTGPIDLDALDDYLMSGLALIRPSEWMLWQSL